MTNTMLEKAASEAKDAFWREVSDHTKDPDWTVIIRAALQAIREPSTEVVEAGMIAGQFTGYADLAFTAMIDAILSEGEA